DARDRDIKDIRLFLLYQKEQKVERAGKFAEPQLESVVFAADDLRGFGFEIKCKLFVFLFRHRAALDFTLKRVACALNILRFAQIDNKICFWRVESVLAQLQDYVSALCRRMKCDVRQHFAESVLARRSFAGAVFYADVESFFFESAKQPFIPRGGFACDVTAFFERKFRPKIKTRRIFSVKPREIFELRYQQM